MRRSGPANWIKVDVSRESMRLERRWSYRSVNAAGKRFVVIMNGEEKRCLSPVSFGNFWLSFATGD